MKHSQNTNTMPNGGSSVSTVSIRELEASTIPIKGLTVSAVTEIVGGKYYGQKANLEQEITGISKSSNEVVEGNIFTAYKGKNTDGNKFIESAIENGALVALTDAKQATSDISQTAPDTPYILVESVQDAVEKIATHYRQMLKIPIVAIIGSVGKTSTKEAIANVLSQKFCVQKTTGNLNNQLGLPISMLSIKEPHEVAVLEMGISNFGEMKTLARITRPDILVFTNVGNCHLENLGDKAGVLKAKSEAFDYMHDNNSGIVLNGDDSILCKIDDINGKKPIKFGLSVTNDIYTTDIKNNGIAGTEGILHIGKQSQAEFKLPLPGMHSVSNMLAAATVANCLQMNIDEIVNGVSLSKNLSGHGQIITTEHLTILDEAYNANPESMEASSDLLETATSRKVAILGDMFELGDAEETLHYQLGQYLALKNIDVLITIGKLANHIADGAKWTKGENKARAKNDINATTQHFETVDEFLENWKNIIKEGDSILVKASNGMNFKKIVEELKNY